MLLTPLKNEKGLIGLISVTRKEPGTFAEHHVQLLRTFADQAVIAIENVRLFDELQARTENCHVHSKNCAPPRTAWCRQRNSPRSASSPLASPTRSKNPLNFVNNFSALSAELVDEMNELLEGAASTKDASRRWTN